MGGGLESPTLFEQGALVWPFCSPLPGEPTQTLGLANSMGLFLQKTNIIRDYLEDYADGRAFWPQEVWTKFARTTELGEFARPTAHGAGVRPGAYDAEADPAGAAIVAKGCRTSGLDCLNFLVADALELVPDSLEYLGRLKTPEVFRFCAIPQVRAPLCCLPVHDSHAARAIVQIRDVTRHTCRRYRPLRAGSTDRYVQEVLTGAADHHGAR